MKRGVLGVSISFTLNRRIALLSAVLVMVTAISVAFAVFYEITPLLTNEALSVMSNEAELVSAHLEARINSLTNDVRFLSSAPPVMGIVRARAAVDGIDPIDGSTEAEWRGRLAAIFESMMEGKTYYYQIRLIGIEDDGREIVRLERDGDRIIEVAESELQAKGDRGYFSDAVKLPQGAFYTSDIDLNREWGEIEVPHVPVVRVAAPVYSDEGEPFGIIVINEDLNDAFAMLRNTALKDHELYLVNASGDFLIHPDPTAVFASDLGHSRDISTSILGFPDADKVMDRVHPGELFHFLSQDERTTIGGVRLSIYPTRPDDTLRIIVTAPRENLLAAFHRARLRILGATCAVIAAGILFSFIVARSMTRPLQNVIESVHQYGNSGDAGVFTREAGGEVGLLVDAFKDMAEQVDARQQAYEKESEIRKSAEEQLRFAATGAGVGTWRWNIEPDEMIWSDMCKALFGLQADDPISYDRFFELVHPEDRERTEAAVQDSVRDHIEYNFEYRAIWPDESVHWRQARGQAYYNDDGTPLRMEGIVLDIEKEKVAQDQLVELNQALTTRASELEALTYSLKVEVAARKDAQEALEQSEQRFRALLESASQGVVVINETGEIQLVNHMTEEMFGYAREDLMGEKLEILFPERDQSKAPWRVFFAAPSLGVNGPDGMPAGRRKNGRRKDGTEFPLEISLSRVSTSVGKLGLALVTDITARQSAEDELESRAEQLAELNEELRHFAYIASHDLQEPLRSISGYVQLLKRRYADQLDTKASGYIDKTVAATARMQNLINDLLAYSRVTTQGDSYREIDCNALVGEATSNLSRAIGESGAKVECENLPKVHGDSVQIAQVFQNLIANAVKFSEGETPIIKISAVHGESGGRKGDGASLDGFWTFAVADNGIGIDPSYFDRIFQMFQRLHTREEFSGTGIGLAICKKIVERHGGSIWLESQRGEGTTFFFTLPGIPS